MSSTRSPSFPVGAIAATSCTDASGNYVGESCEVAVDAYIGVESIAGRLLCPGCRRPTPRPWSADPALLAVLMYSGTSDENLYLVCESQLRAREVSARDAPTDALSSMSRSAMSPNIFAQAQNSR